MSPWVTPGPSGGTVPGLSACDAAPKPPISTGEFRRCHSPHQLPPWQGTRSSEPRPKHLRGSAAKLTIISATGVSHYLALIHVLYLREANDRNPEHPKLRVIKSKTTREKQGRCFPHNAHVAAKIPKKCRSTMEATLQSGQSVPSRPDAGASRPRWLCRPGTPVCV